MIRKYCFAVLLIILVGPVARAQDVRQLADGVFYYFGDELQRKPSNCIWVIFKNYVLVVDANYPWGAEEIIKEIKKTTNKPIRYVFNTHYHHDHTFGNDAFVREGAVVISTVSTAQEMRTIGEKEWQNASGYSGRNMDGATRQFPEITFSDSMVLDDGSQRVELIRMGPAHTKGDGVVYLPKEQILVTGDLFVHGNPWSNNVADEHADYSRWLRVLDTLATWNTKIIIPGHGLPCTREELRHQRAYLADLFHQVRTGVKAGKTKHELINSIDLSKHPVYGANTKAVHRSIGELYDRMIRE